jgi:hypothetical protein
MIPATVAHAQNIAAGGMKGRVFTRPESTQAVHSLPAR